MNKNDNIAELMATIRSLESLGACNLHSKINKETLSKLQSKLDEVGEVEQIDKKID